MPPFVCLQAGAGQGLCSPLWPSLWGLGASPEALRRIVQIAPGLPGFRWKSHSSLRPRAVPECIKAMSVPWCCLMLWSSLQCVICHDGFSHNAFFSSVSVREKEQIMCPCGSQTCYLQGWGAEQFPPPPEWIPPAKAAFSFPLFSLFPPPPYSDFSSSAKCFLQVKAFISQEHLELQIIFMSSLIHLLVLIVFTQQIMI